MKKKAQKRCKKIMKKQQHKKWYVFYIEARR